MNTLLIISLSITALVTISLAGLEAGRAKNAREAVEILLLGLPALLIALSGVVVITYFTPYGFIYYCLYAVGLVAFGDKVLKGINTK